MACCRWAEGGGEGALDLSIHCEDLRSIRSIEGVGGTRPGPRPRLIGSGPFPSCPNGGSKQPTSSTASPWSSTPAPVWPCPNRTLWTCRDSSGEWLWLGQGSGHVQGPDVQTPPPTTESAGPQS